MVETDCDSFCVNILGKDMNPSFLRTHLILAELLGKLGSLALVGQSV